MGTGIPVFGAGWFGVRARHGSVEGEYALFMPMTTEQATVGGRETFGEPKKIGGVSIDVDGDTRAPRASSAWASRSPSVTGTLGAPIDIAAEGQGRLLLQVQPVARRQGLRHRARARALPPARRGARRPRDRRHAHAARLAARPDRRHPGRPRSCRCSSREVDDDADRRGRRARAGRLAAAVRAPALRRPVGAREEGHDDGR